MLKSLKHKNNNQVKTMLEILILQLMKNLILNKEQLMKLEPNTLMIIEKILLLMNLIQVPEKLMVHINNNY